MNRYTVLLFDRDRVLIVEFKGILSWNGREAYFEVMNVVFHSTYLSLRED